MDNTTDEIIRLFSQTPPQYSLIKDKLKAANLNKDELIKIAASLLDDCSNDEYEINSAICVNEAKDSRKIGNLHGDYIYHSIKLLFDFGLDANGFYESGGDSDSLLYLAAMTDYPHETPRVVSLFLQHGADPNSASSKDPEEESVFDMADFEIYFYELSNIKYYTLFQIWLLLIAYGAKRNGETPVKFRNKDCDVSVFKDYERYTYKFTSTPPPGEKAGEPYLYIIDKSSGEYIAYS